MTVPVRSSNAPVLRRATGMRPIRTRVIILEAARELFYNRPFDTVTVEMIAAHAGLTRRTIYNQFADAAALFRATREQLVHEIAELLPVNVSTDLPARVALRLYCRQVATAFSDPRYIELVGSLVRDGWSAPWLIDGFERHVRFPIVRCLEAYLQALRVDQHSSKIEVRHVALSLLRSLESVAISTRLLPRAEQSSDEVPDCTPDLIDSFVDRIVP